MMATATTPLSCRETLCYPPSLDSYEAPASPALHSHSVAGSPVSVAAARLFLNQHGQELEIQQEEAQILTSDRSRAS